MCLVSYITSRQRGPSHELTLLQISRFNSVSCSWFGASQAARVERQTDINSLCTVGVGWEQQLLKGLLACLVHGKDERYHFHLWFFSTFGDFSANIFFSVQSQASCKIYPFAPVRVGQNWSDFAVAAAVSFVRSLCYYITYYFNSLNKALVKPDWFLEVYVPAFHGNWMKLLYLQATGKDSRDMLNWKCLLVLRTVKFRVVFLLILGILI